MVCILYECVMYTLVSAGATVYHEPPHSLFLNALILFLLLPFSVGVVGGHGFGQLLHFAGDGTVVLLKVFGVLQDAV